MFKANFSIGVDKETGLNYIVLVCEEITCWLFKKKRMFLSKISWLAFKCTIDSS